jgi:hypothetical protein
MILNYEIYKNDFFPTILLELKNGVLAMRLTSITLGFTFIMTLKKLIRMTPFPDSKTEQEYSNYKEADLIGLSSQPRRNRFEHYFLNLTQSSFYSLILTVLWILYLLGIDSLSSILLSYFLFLIIDEWTIVFDYSLRLRGYIIRWHFIKVLILNITLLVTGILATSSNLILQVTFCLLAIYILIINYLNYKKKLFIKTQYDYEKNVSP